MDQLNIKHIFNGEVTPLRLGDMSISAALFTAYHVQNDTEFTMTTLTVGEKNFATINILGLPVFFDLETDTGNLTLIQDIEKELLNASDEEEYGFALVHVFKQLEDFNNDIDDMSQKISNTDIYNDFFKEAIEDYNEGKSSTPREVEEEFDEDEDMVNFKNIEVFDGHTEFELDIAIPEVAELLDDVIDIDEEITELKDMAKNMLEEANYITKNGYKMEDDEYHYDEDEDDKKFTNEDFYWVTTVEEDEKYGITPDTFKKESIDYIDKEVADMEDKKSSTPNDEFNERLDNMLEFMLTQSSVGHDPKYKFEHTKQGQLAYYKDDEGEFLIPEVDRTTKFSADSHVITLRITRKKGDTEEVTIEESELMGEFTMNEVIREVKQNSKYLKDATAELQTMQTKKGKVIWESKK